MPFLKRHYDKTVTIIAVVIVLVLFAPTSLLLYHQTAQNYHESMVAMADIGAEQSAKSLLSALHEDIDIWDADYRRIGFEEFKAAFCEERAAIDRDYFDWLAGGERARFHVDYDDHSALKSRIMCIQKSFRNANPFKVHYAEIIDRNGYVPWHGVANEKCIGNKEWDLVHNRQKRMWRKALLSASDQMSERRLFVHVTDYGEEQNIAAAPISVDGKIWGWFLVSYFPFDASYVFIGQMGFFLLVSALLVGGVFNVYILSVINRLYDAHIARETHC